jgi:hypothetical protein
MFSIGFFSFNRLSFSFPVVELKEGIEADHKFELQEGQEVRAFFWQCFVDEKN